GRVLEAPCRRAHFWLRTADLHHRRRHPPAHTADGDHASLRLVRGLERRRELPPARGPPARFEPRQPGRVTLNKQVSHVGVAALALLAALIVATTYCQTWANAGLANRQDNDIRLVAQFSINRGKVYAADGRTILARNIQKKAGGQTLYFRRYPTGPLFADVVGYSTQSRNRTGMEQSYNDYLTGSNANLDTVFRSALDKLKGTTVKGNNLVLTIRPGAQAIANPLPAGKCGPVVALEPATGRVLVMATSPTYNPNLVESRFNLATRTRLPCGAPLLNRATAGKYPPGSTFT